MNRRLGVALEKLKDYAVFDNMESANYAFLSGILMGLMHDLASCDKKIENALIYKINEICDPIDSE